MVVILLGYAWGDWAFGLEQRYLINIFPGSRILEQKASQPNHTSHRKVQFYEFVQIVLCCDMGTIIFDLHGYGGCQRPKT